MTPKIDTPFETDPAAFLLKELTTRALEKDEYALASQSLEDEHYLGDRPLMAETFTDIEQFAGRHTLTSIGRYGNRLTNQQRRWLDFPVKKAPPSVKCPVGAPFTTS